LFFLYIKHANESVDQRRVIEALQQQAARQPGSIEIRVNRRRPGTVVMLGLDLLTLLDNHKELDWHE
jgi:hypothetical protein